jgi:PEP-utilising enzyme, PEP-binding domain
MLGFRGAARYISQEFGEAFAMECEALKRVRNDMGLTNVEIMVPFVRTLGQAKAVGALLAKDFDERDPAVKAMLAMSIKACLDQAKPGSAVDLLVVMFKRALDLHQTTFALGEVIAHLHFLWFKSELKREFCTDGIYWFSSI